MSLKEEVMGNIDRVRGHGSKGVTELDSYEPDMATGPQNDFSRYAPPSVSNSHPAYTDYDAMDDPAEDTLGTPNSGGTPSADIIPIGTGYAESVVDAVPNNIVTSQVAVNVGSVVQLLPERPGRASVVIYNTSQSVAAVIYLGGSSATANSYGGFPMPAGSTFTMATTTEVWVSTAADTVVACMEYVYS